MPSLHRPFPSHDSIVTTASSWPNPSFEPLLDLHFTVDFCRSLYTSIYDCCHSIKKKV
jgi:hypothetical protein